VLVFGPVVGLRAEQEPVCRGEGPRTLKQIVRLDDQIVVCFAGFGPTVLIRVPIAVARLLDARYEGELVLLGRLPRQALRVIADGPLCQVGMAEIGDVEELVRTRVPGRRSTIRYTPWPSVTTLRTFSISAGLVASIWTPGRTPPVESLTVPEIAPFKAACAQACPGCARKLSATTRYTLFPSFMLCVPRLRVLSELRVLIPSPRALPPVRALLRNPSAPRI
jgi:hypothetical protein